MTLLLIRGPNSVVGKLYIMYIMSSFSDEKSLKSLYVENCCHSQFDLLNWLWLTGQWVGLSVMRQLCCELRAFLLCISLRPLCIKVSSPAFYTPHWCIRYAASVRSRAVVIVDSLSSARVSSREKQLAGWRRDWNRTVCSLPSLESSACIWNRTVLSSHYSSSRESNTNSGQVR